MKNRMNGLMKLCILGVNSLVMNLCMGYLTKYYAKMVITGVDPEKEFLEAAKKSEEEEESN